MVAAIREYDTPTSHFDYPIALKQKGNTKIFNGTLVSTDATGFAVPAADVVATNPMGRSNTTSDTTAAGPNGLLADGVASVEVLIGIVELDNPVGANQLTQVDVGKLAFVFSDHEVCRTAGTVNARIAGKVLAVDLVRAKATIDLRQHAV